MNAATETAARLRAEIGLTGPLTAAAAVDTLRVHYGLQITAQHGGVSVTTFSRDMAGYGVLGLPMATADHSPDSPGRVAELAMIGGYALGWKRASDADGLPRDLAEFARAFCEGERAPSAVVTLGEPPAAARKTAKKGAAA